MTLVTTLKEKVKTKVKDTYFIKDLQYKNIKEITMNKLKVIVLILINFIHL